MSSRSRNFRRRAGDDEDDADDTPNIAAAKPSPKPSATAAKPKKPPQQGPKRLSFVDDDEESETSPSSRPLPKPSNPSRSSSSRLGKPSSSHKITAVKDRLAPSSPAVFASNVQPQAGTYTKEALRELQKNTRTLASSSSSSSRASSDSRPVSSQSQPIVLLRGLVKPISETVREAAELDSEDEGEDGGNEKDKDDSESRNRLASMRIGKGKDASLFPDQATIDAIRAKRERLRQSRAAAPDYIALDGGSNHGEREGLSDEEPEFQSRIAMFGEKVEGVKKGVFESMDDKPVDEGLKDDDAEDNDEDEEEKIWEEEQFRKGLGKRMDDETSKLVSSVPVVHTVQQQKYTPMTSVSMAPSIGGVHGATQSGDALSISQKAEVAMKALQENARRIKESHGRTVSSLTKTDENLSASLLNITALESSLSAAGEKFIFMQKLRDFVSVICDFLQHKAPYIEELEEQMQKLHEARASAIMERRTADNEDEIKEVEAAVDAAMYELSKGGNTAALLAAATSAAQAASAAVKEQKNLPPKLDEMGRDLNLQKRMDMRRRAEARQRRKAISDSKRMSAMEVDGSSQRIEGESSTDESDSESVAYQSNRDTLLQTADLIFSDASEEYSQLSVVKERFERWKTLFSSSYRDAYMALSVPAIFSPYVRLELLKWDPLHKESDFFDMNWHSLLFDYGMLEGGSEFSPDDADANLVPGLVEKVALPILHHEVVHCWDMLSSQETKNAVSATGLVTNYVPASSEALGELLVAIRTRLDDAVMNVMVPTWSPLILKAVPNAARVAAYRFGVAVRLLRNISLWKDILALSALEKLALDELLCGKILPHVRCITPSIHDAVTRSERIIASLSGVWTGPSVTGGRSRKLQPLVDYVQLLGKTLEKKHFSGMTESETSGLARRLKKMLVELNEYDSARDMARTFCVKEAL